MINGAHVIVLSKQPEADRAFFRDVLGLPHVDVGRGWLIFGLPPAEVAVHPADRESVHELYLMCEDVSALVTVLAGRGITCGPIEDQGWGLLTSITLPGGGKLGAYQPRHARPAGTRPASARASARGAASKPGASKKRAPGKARAKKLASKAASRKQAGKNPAPKKAPKRAAGRKRR